MTTAVNDKERRKYDRLVDQAKKLEDEQPFVALELYRYSGFFYIGSIGSIGSL